MTEILLGLLLLIGIVLIILQVVQISRQKGDGVTELKPQIDGLDKSMSRIEQSIRSEFTQNREQANTHARQIREEIGLSMKTNNESVLTRMTEIAQLQKNQLDTFSSQITQLTKGNEERQDKLRTVVEDRLKQMQEDNSQKLEQMRQTVDEKLHTTLEKRLGESFKLVSDRLEQVQKGLGEMQSLASGVGDLKKVLTNIKSRGTLGEIQLGTLLEQLLTQEQYEKNIRTKKGSNEQVEFAIKLPGRNGKENEPVYLPIDSKFPIEDYQRLLDAQEQADSTLVDQVSKQLEKTIRDCAKAIRDKYLDPPHTTDFALMFLPTEGLYAEILRRPGLWDKLQREYRVIITGPTTLSAILNSLQMGFRTLAVEKRSSEVWTLLGAVKTEFGRFGELLDKTHKKLQEASNTIEDAGKRTRAIERKMRAVQELPVAEATVLLGETEEIEIENNSN